MIGRDVPDAAHVGRKVIDPVDVPGRLLAVLPKPQVEQLEVVGGAGLEFRNLDIDAANAKSVRFQTPDQVMADESAGTRH